jgi:hypothetical protein
MLTGISNKQIEVYHQLFDKFKLYVEEADELAFCENESNMERVFGKPNDSPYVKDGVNNYIISGDKKYVNPNDIGTKASAVYRKEVPAGESVSIRLRFSPNTQLKDAFGDFDTIFDQRLAEADAFYGEVQKNVQNEEMRKIQRQAFAGMMWCKQFYFYNINQWLKGDPKMPFEFRGRAFQRNNTWKHAYMGNILSMPDKWEYPWFAAWDLAFHTLTLARIDPDFAKRQLAVVLREYYMHPNGQIPAYEWNFSDVNPPVHAWATWQVYEIDKKSNGGVGDVAFLERIFHKLLLNFTWWINQKDQDGNGLFGGGFLGLDNIGVFDRNAQIPGVQLQQADATGWMAMYTLNMLRIACEIAIERPSYQDMASKFFEHFLYIAEAINRDLDEGFGLWDQEDQFYYDKVNTPQGDTLFMKIRSLVGLIPLAAVEVLDEEMLNKLPDFKRRVEWVLNNRPDLASLISRWHEPGKGETHLLSLLRGHRMKMVLKRMFDESEFLSDYGIRSMSKYHEEHPFTFNLHGEHLSAKYVAGESDLAIMGGNSNWRGPVWFPLNYLLVDSLMKFYSYYGDDYEVEYPTNSGNIMSIQDAANKISERLVSIFQVDKSGVKPAMRNDDVYAKDEHFKDLNLFYEYFNGDNGSGCGASHQTGWTGLVADLIEHISVFKQMKERTDNS